VLSHTSLAANLANSTTQNSLVRRAIFVIWYYQYMEAEPDPSLVLRPCRVVCPYMEAHSELDPPEDCYGPASSYDAERGKVLFCWLIQQEVSDTGEVMVSKLPPSVEEARRMDPERWQELYNQYLDELVAAEVFKLRLVADSGYSQSDADYVQQRTVYQIALDMKVNLLTGEGASDERFEYLAALRVGFEYYPNVEPFKRGDITWEQALKRYYILRYPRAKGVASQLLRTEIERKLFEQLDGDA